MKRKLLEPRLLNPQEFSGSKHSGEDPGRKQGGHNN
jgi:hypothetical protein